MHPSPLPYWRLSGYYFFYFAYVGAFSPYFGLYLQSRGFSAWDIAVLMSQMQLMRLCSPNFWGWIADHSRADQRTRLTVIRLTSLLAVACFGGLFIARGFAAHLGVMALLAFFWSASMPLVEALTFDHLHAEPARYSRVRLWGSVGFVIAVLSIGAVLDHLPLASLLPMALLLLLAVLACTLSIPDAPTIAHAASQRVRDVLRQARVRALLAAAFCMSAAHGAYYVFYSIYLSEHGYSKSLVGGLWSLGVVAEIGAFLLMPRLMRRFGLRWLLLASFVAAVLRFLLIGAAVDWWPLMVVAQLLHALTFGVHHATSIAAIHRWFPGRCQARGQALYSSLSFGAGGLFGGIVSGWSWDAWGGSLTFAFGAVFAVLGWGLLLLWFPHRDAAEPVPAV
jgi:PPP family 3-phenylpropionic acid transporter